MCTIVFVTVFFSSLLGRSWRVLSSLDRLLGSLGLLLGPPGALLAASWSLLRRSWGSLGTTWAPLGSSWGGLGATWAPLGSSWSHPKQHQEIMLKKINFKSSKRTSGTTVDKRPTAGGLSKPVQFVALPRSLDRIQDEVSALLGSARRNAQASWVELKGGKRLRQDRFAPLC